jgi:hypothetical protein
MIDPDIEREEEANAERKAQGDAAKGNHGILGTIEQAFRTVLSPLAREDVSEADIESRRAANDAEERV